MWSNISSWTLLFLKAHILSLSSLHSRKTVRYSGQIMSMDKYLNIIQCILASNSLLLIFKWQSMSIVTTSTRPWLAVYSNVNNQGWCWYFQKLKLTGSRRSCCRTLLLLSHKCHIISRQPPTSNCNESTVKCS